MVDLTLYNYNRDIIVFMLGSLAVTVGLQLIIPFPYGLGAALAIFTIFPFFLRRRYLKRMRGYGGSGSGAGGGGGFFGMGQGGGGGGGTTVRYVCLVCNHKHKGSSCPRCGSKTHRVDF